MNSVSAAGALRSVFSICAQNFRKWQTDYRIWCIAAVLIVMTSTYVGDMRRICAYTGTQLPIWVFPFLYSQFYTKLVFTLPVVLLFCSAPFNDANQTFVYLRAGRLRWFSAQLLYIAAASALYYLFLLALSLLMTVFTGERTAGWGETLPMLAADGYSGINIEANAGFVTVSYMITAFFKPIQAVGFTFLMSWLGAVVIGLVNFLFNLMTGVKTAGILASSFLVILSCAVDNDIGSWRRLIRVSPISWITLDKIDVGGLTRNPPFIYCLLFDLGLIVVLIVLILVFGRRKSLDVKG